MTWCAVFVAHDPAQKQHFFLIKTENLAAASRKFEGGHALLLAVHCDNMEEANAFMHLWLQSPRTCRAPVSFAAKAEGLAALYKKEMVCDFNLLFDTDTPYEFICTHPECLETLSEQTLMIPRITKDTITTLEQLIDDAIPAQTVHLFCERPERMVHDSSVNHEFL